MIKMDFPYNTDVVSKRLFDEHQKLYAGYIGKMNEINTALANDPNRAAANATYSEYRGLKKGETFALNGVILHELYFENMGDSPKHMGAATTDLLTRFFGGADEWKADFIACALSARGWCITGYDQRQGVIRNFAQDAHDDGVITMAHPIIALDMYEHAYFMDYGTDKAGYIAKFINNIDWSVVEERSARVAEVL